MHVDRLIFRLHAVERMFERGIEANDVRQILTNGETIENYPNDMPFPSCLMLGWIASRPIHVVVAHNASEQETYIITTYEPDLVRWKPGFKERVK